MTIRQDPQLTANARELRVRQTQAESLLWCALRARRVDGLKFRRQYPIDPYIVDFACIEKMQVIEIDGGYHDYIYLADQNRQRYLESKGWNVLRFTNEDVIEDVEAVVVCLKKHLGLAPSP